MKYDVALLKQVLAQQHNCPQRFSERGIVISAGGPSLISAYITVRSLRQQRCQLPIQIWHMGCQELPDRAARPFLPWQVEFVDSFKVRAVNPMRCFGAWENKIFAMTWSSFAEVLLLDADNMVLQNPEFLLSDPNYMQHGAIFWPDFPATAQDFWSIKEAAWELLGLPKTCGAELEAGQILIDKRRRWKELMIAYHMNENSDFYYQHCTHGDKDTYTLAWMLNNAKLNVVAKRPVMTHAPIRIQFGPDGAELFQHSRKWTLPWDSNQKLQQFRDEELCLTWLRELQQQLE